MLKSISIKALCLCSLLTCGKAIAYDFSNLFNLDNVSDIVNDITTTKEIGVKDLAGTWSYKAPAIIFDSDDIVTNMGGSALSSSIENQLAPYYFKAGLKNASVTIYENGKFIIKTPKGNFNGTITKIDNEHFSFTFDKFYMINNSIKIEALVRKSSTLEIAFDLSRAIPIIKKIAEASGKEIMQSAVDLLESYDGIYGGIELKKE